MVKHGSSTIERTKTGEQVFVLVVVAIILKFILKLRFPTDVSKLKVISKFEISEQLSLYGI